MGIVKTRKLSVRPKIILFSKTVQDYGNRSADICLVMQAVGQAGHSLSMCILRSLWFNSGKFRREKVASGQAPLGWNSRANTDPRAFKSSEVWLLGTRKKVVSDSAPKSYFAVKCFREN